MAAAIVTGAGGGIGRAISLQLAAMGHDVVLVGRTAASLESVAGEIRAARKKALVVAADVSQSAQVRTILDRVLAEFGGADVLVNNAGFAPLAPLHETTDEQWRQIVDVNLSSAFYLTRALWPVMRSQFERRSAALPAGAPPAAATPITGGAIINISSMASRDPFPGLGAYGAAKAALNLLTLTTAREGAAVGIRALCIAPAAVETPMLRGLFSAAQLPPEKVMQPEEIARIVASFVDGTLAIASGETLFVQRL